MAENQIPQPAEASATPSPASVPPPPQVEAAKEKTTPIAAFHNDQEGTHYVVFMDGQRIGTAEGVEVRKIADGAARSSGPVLQRPATPVVVPRLRTAQAQASVAVTADPPKPEPQAQTVFTPRTIQCEWCGAALNIQAPGGFACENCNVRYRVNRQSQVEFQYRRPPRERRRRQQAPQQVLQTQAPQVQIQAPQAPWAQMNLQTQTPQVTIPPPPELPSTSVTVSGPAGGAIGGVAPVTGAWSFLSNWDQIRKKGWKFFVLILILFLASFFLTPGVYIGEVEDWSAVRTDPNTGLPLVDGILVDRDNGVVYMGPKAGYVQRAWVAYHSAAYQWRVVPVQGFDGDMAEDLGAVDYADLPTPVTEEMQDDIATARYYLEKLYQENDYNSGFGLMRDQREDFRRLAEALARLEAQADIPFDDLWERNYGDSSYTGGGTWGAPGSAGPTSYGSGAPPPIAGSEEATNTVRRGRDALRELRDDLQED